MIESESPSTALAYKCCHTLLKIEICDKQSTCGTSWQNCARAIVHNLIVIVTRSLKRVTFYHHTDTVASWHRGTSISCSASLSIASLLLPAAISNNGRQQTAAKRQHSLAPVVTWPVSESTQLNAAARRECANENRNFVEESPARLLLDGLIFVAAAATLTNKQSTRVRVLL